MGKTHSQMIKFANADDVDFCKVLKLLTAMVAEIATQREQIMI
jgi:hypothetical protein